jgi:hypothetical protein
MEKGWLWGLVLAGGGSAIIVACSAPPSNQTPLLICTAGENGCPGEKTPTPPKKNTSSSSSEDDGDPALETKQLVDAGIDAESEEPALGKICTALKGCCGQLKEAGYSTATCDDIIKTKNESACSLQHRSYREYGDCS